jgi:BolA protein
MSRKDRMERALGAAFTPETLLVRDESAKHFGHAGARPEGETHYDVTIVAEAFRGLSRVERHRRVNAVLAAEFEQGLHALGVVAKAPGE